MRARLGAIIAGLVAAAGAAALPAAGAAQPPRVALRGFFCQAAANPRNRAIEVTAVMRPLPATRRMQMRFVLLRRSAWRAPFLPVRGRGLNIWLNPADPTLGQRAGDTWVLNKPVVNLPAPAAYRLRVSFRWLGAGGVIGTATRLSPICHQPA